MDLGGVLTGCRNVDDGRRVDTHIHVDPEVQVDPSHDGGVNLDEDLGDAQVAAVGVAEGQAD